MENKTIENRTVTINVCGKNINVNVTVTPIDEPKEKECTKCHKTYELWHFRVRKNKTHANRCIPCDRLKTEEEYANYVKILNVKQSIYDNSQISEKLQKCNRCNKEMPGKNFKIKRDGKITKCCNKCRTSVCEYNTTYYGDVTNRVKRCMNDTYRRVKHCNVGVGMPKDVLFGCDVKTYKTIIESKFLNGMNWDNYGTVWQIDHIIPLAYSNPALPWDNPTYVDKLKRINCVNIKPMFIKDNVLKRNTIPDNEKTEAARVQHYLDHIKAFSGLV